MKKVFSIFLLSSLVVSSVFGVTRLTYEQHALKNDVHNDMVITQFQDPGLPGPNQVWDFSNLKLIQDFNGTIQSPNYVKSSFFANNFNTELIEFGNSFYFNISKEQIEMTGFRSKTGGTEIAYDKPFVKMKYPFEYGNSFRGSFAGVVKAGSVTGEVNGTYDVEADAYGRLILPGNQIVEDALRVKTIKNYTQQLSNSTSEITITTYRWYTQNVRYPLLVFITTEYNNNGRKNVSHTAAYKTGIEQRINNTVYHNGIASFYPNPFNESFSVTYEMENAAKVTIEVFDLTGKKIANLLNEAQPVGVYNQEFNVEKYDLKNGMYNIKIIIDGVTQNQQLLHIK